MAIGKVNAFATIQAPKADFGEIALNAQKFQQADLERQKEMIPKKEKPKVDEWKDKPSETLSNTAYVTPYDQSIRAAVISKVERINELNEENRLNPNGPNRAKNSAEIDTHNQFIKTHNNILSKVATDGTNFVVKLEKSGDDKVYSEVNSSKINYVKKFTKSKDNNELFTDVNGMQSVRVVVTDDKGFPVLDSNGKKQYETFIDKDGSERNYITFSEIENGDLFSNYTPYFNTNKYTSDIADKIGYREYGTDSGITNQVKREIPAEKLIQAKSFIEQDLTSNRDKLVDALYQADPKKYAVPQKEYTDADIAFATKNVYDRFLAKTGSKDVTNVDFNAAKTAADAKKNEPTISPLLRGQGYVYGKLNPNSGLVTFKDNKLAGGGSVFRSASNPKEFNKFAYGYTLQAGTVYKDGKQAVGLLRYPVWKGETKAPSEGSQVQKAVSEAKRAFETGQMTQEEYETKVVSLGASFEEGWFVMGANHFNNSINGTQGKYRNFNQVKGGLLGIGKKYYGR